MAHLARVKESKSAIHLKALIEISNYCKNSCVYCGLRRENRTIKRYKLTSEQIVKKAAEALNLGYKTIVLQSGESAVYNVDEICKTIGAIKALGARITLSFGEKSFDEYRAYKEAGANRYLLRIETTDEALYKKLHPNMSLQSRLKALDNLQRLGYETGSGIIVGVPGQDETIIAKDIFYLKEKDFDMIGVGPFVPCEHTPLCDSKGGDFTLSLKVMAIIRLLMPTINIPATTAMETICKNGRTKALKSGANVVMPAIAEYKYRKNYLLYKNKVTDNIELKEQLKTITDEIALIGHNISKESGDSQRFKKKISK